MEVVVAGSSKHKRSRNEKIMIVVGILVAASMLMGPLIQWIARR
jgi:hypothetical protein